MKHDDLPAGLELNLRVALEVMGWHEWDGVGDWTGPAGVELFTRFAGDDALYLYDFSSAEPSGLPWDPCRHDAAADDVEARLEVLELELPYVRNLIARVLGADALVRHQLRGLDTDQVWVLLCASSEQRARAALATVRGEHRS